MYMEFVTDSKNWWLFEWPYHFLSLKKVNIYLLNLSYTPDHMAGAGG